MAGSGVGTSGGKVMRNKGGLVFSTGTVGDGIGPGIHISSFLLASGYWSQLRLAGQAYPNCSSTGKHLS